MSRRLGRRLVEGIGPRVGAKSHYAFEVQELRSLRIEHAPAVLAFEVANRSYFAKSISDRGDDYFERFDEEFDSSLLEQEKGTCRLHVLVDDDGAVLGRFNLYEINVGSAVLGYRVAQHVAGRGVATAAVLELCRRAATQYGVGTLRAATAHDNFASQRVLTKCGFELVGPALVAGRPGSWYQRALFASREPTSPRDSGDRPTW